MKKNLLFFILFIIVSVSVKAQQQIAFSFGESPQTLMLNPGAETNFSRHYGIPIFSNFSLTLGTTGFELADLFLKDNRDFTSKFRDVLSKVNQDDYININAKIGSAKDEISQYLASVNWPTELQALGEFLINFALQKLRGENIPIALGTA